MPVFHCELEHDVAAFIYMVFLTFLGRETFKAMNWVFFHHLKGILCITIYGLLLALEKVEVQQQRCRY